MFILSRAGYATEKKVYRLLTSAPTHPTSHKKEVFQPTKRDKAAHTLTVRLSYNVLLKGEKQITTKTKSHKYTNKTNGVTA